MRAERVQATCSVRKGVGSIGVSVNLVQRESESRPVELLQFTDSQETHCRDADELQVWRVEGEQDGRCVVMSLSFVILQLRTRKKTRSYALTGSQSSQIRFVAATMNLLR